MDFNTFCISGNGNEYPLQVSYLLIYFTCKVNMTSLSLSWYWSAGTASAACVARLEALADWWRSWPMANTLVCLCSCQWWTFWTMSICFLCAWWTLCLTPRLMLWVHYRSMTCDVSFWQGSTSTLFSRGEHVIRVCVKLFFRLTAVQEL